MAGEKRLRSGRWPPTITLEEDNAWEPLADFIRQLPTLTEVVYNCSNQLSRCILEVLHRERSDCRLHMKTFYFRSLHERKTDHHEFALATSPCLHSIFAQYPSFDYFNMMAQEDFNEEAVLRTISVAPKLKKARLFQTPMPGDLDLERAAQRPRRLWQGFSLASIRN
jgi:hypothetical protein